MPTNRKDLIRNLKQAAKNNTLMTPKHNPNNLGTAMKGFRTVLSFDLASNLNSFIDSEDFRVYSYIRVRKSSLEKELKKQKDVINQIRNAIKEDKRVGNGSVIESCIHRLIGMSIGRVDLWNYENIDNEMCWKNGFQEINKNKYSIKQLKELDRSRNKLYYKLISDLYSEEEEEEEEEEENIEDKKLTNPRQIFNYDKPFSYYYQVVERTKS